MTRKKEAQESWENILAKGVWQRNFKKKNLICGVKNST